MNSNTPTNLSAVADTTEWGAPGSNLARATLPPELHQQGGSGAQIILDGLRGNGRIALKVLHEVEAAVEATTAVWDTESKRFVSRPDFRTRLAACELFLSHVVGLPVQRSENLNINAQAKPEQTDAEVLSSPAMRNELRRMLAKADREAASRETVQRAG